jgi:hypothetical protein
MWRFSINSLPFIISKYFANLYTGYIYFCYFVYLRLGSILGFSFQPNAFVIFRTGIQYFPQLLLRGSNPLPPPHPPKLTVGAPDIVLYEWGVNAVACIAQILFGYGKNQTVPLPPDPM